MTQGSGQASQRSSQFHTPQSTPSHPQSPAAFSPNPNIGRCERGANNGSTLDPQNSSPSHHRPVISEENTLPFCEGGGGMLDHTDAEGPFLGNIFGSPSRVGLPTSAVAGAPTGCKQLHPLRSQLTGKIEGGQQQQDSIFTDGDDDGEDGQESLEGGWQPDGEGAGVGGGGACWPTWAEYAPEEEAISTVWAELLSVDEEVGGEWPKVWRFGTE